MYRLADLQRRFAAALADAALPIPVASPARRFDIHRNTVQAGIVGVLEARYPIVKRLVGDGFFLTMARDFLQRSPPKSPILMLYGDGFANFIAGYAAAADVPYLADVARLEWQQHEASNAAEAGAISSADLAAVPIGRVGDVRLRLHPSLRLFSSAFPALTIWQLNVASGGVAPAKLAAAPEYALILRPRLEVEIRRIDAAMHTFCTSLQSGVTLGAAVEAAMALSDHFNVQQSLAGLIAMGAVAGYDLAVERR